MFGRVFWQGSSAGTVRDQHSGTAALVEFEAPEQKSSVQIVEWNMPYLPETDHYEDATGGLGVVNADLEWKMEMVVAGSEHSGLDVAREASLRSAPR